MNAKDEFIKHIEGRKVLCAKLDILRERGYSFDNSTGDRYSVHILCMGHNPEDYNNFLKSIDFEYDSGYGGQELDGTIWYEDMSWSERGEYDGSEWWEYMTIPEIPFELFRKDTCQS